MWFEIHERGQPCQYHHAVAGGPIRWHPRLALEAEEFTNMRGMRALRSAHRLPPGGTDLMGPSHAYRTRFITPVIR